MDYDGDQRIDLARSPADVIGSVANYFKSYGWQPGMPTHYPVDFDVEHVDMEALLAPDMRTSWREKNIPRSIGQLVNLESLYLGYNDFTGSIPRETVEAIKARAVGEAPAEEEPRREQPRPSRVAEHLCHPAHDERCERTPALNM